MILHGEQVYVEKVRAKIVEGFEGRQKKKFIRKLDSTKKIELIKN